MEPRPTLLLLQLKLYVGSHRSDFKDASSAAESTSQTQAESEGHELLKLMETSIRVGLRFCLREYIETVSRELHRRLDGQRLSDLQSKNPSMFLSQTFLSWILLRISAVAAHSDAPPWHQPIHPAGIVQYTFLCQAGQQSVCMYTDGSVYGKGVGFGASFAVLYHPSPSTGICYKSSALGRMVSIEECEVDGIILGIDMITHTHTHTHTRLTALCPGLPG